MTALIAVPDVWLPDGTVLRGADALGVQQPRFWTAPPRHRDPDPGCLVCAKRYYEDRGCGDYLSAELLDWAPGFGYELDPWQEWYLTEACGTKPDGRWASFENMLVCSRQNGKNVCIEVRELGGLFLFGESLLIHTAHEFKAAAEHFRRVRDVVTGYDELRRRIKSVTTSHGDEAIELRAAPTLIFGPGGRQVRRTVRARLRFLARSRGSGRAFTADFVAYDEAMILSDAVVSASLPTLSAVPNPQIFYTASAGYKDSVQLAAVRRRVLRGDTNLMGAEWSISAHTDSCPRDEIRGRRTNHFVVCDQHDDRDDPRSWAKANPALGRRVSVEHVAKELEAMTTGDAFDRERLGVGDWPGGDETWAVVSEEAWNACAMPDPGGATRPVAFAIDVDPDMTCATIAAAWYRPEPERKVPDDETMMLMMQAAIKTGLPLPPQRTVQAERPVIEIPRGCSREGVAWVVPRLIELQKAWRPVAVAIPRNGPAAGLIDDAEKVGIEVTKMSSADEAAAFALFVTMVRKPAADGRLIHLGRELAPGLWSSVASAETRDVGDGGRAWSRRDSAADITPVSSGTNALWVLNRKRRHYDPLKSVAGPGRASAPGWMMGA
jgi:hypothetical protein